jgi:Right handed beta helix region
MNPGERLWRETGGGPSHSKRTRGWARQWPLAVLLAGVFLGLNARLPAYAETVLHVAPSTSMRAAGNGTREAPFTTIGEAVARWSASPPGSAFTILIAPGIYRESIQVQAPPHPSHLRIRAEAQGTVVLSGSDVVAGQRKEVDTVTIPYRDQFPISTIPSDWPTSLRIRKMARLRDMVFANDVPLRQVLQSRELTAGSFLVDHSAAQIEIKLPAGMDPSTARIEVARRARLLTVTGVNGIEISGLIFEHAASEMIDSAVVVDHSKRVQITSSSFRRNNGGGIQIQRSRNITLDGNVMEWNGSTGLGIWRVEDLTARDNRTWRNNWRGHSGGFIGWSSAGMKAFSLHRARFERHSAGSNFTLGFWLDTDISDVVVRDAEICDNLWTGLMVEAVQGPVEIADSRICRNAEGGVLGAEARALRLLHNTIACNARRQIFVSGQLDRRVVDFVTGKRFILNNEGWIVEGNRVGAVRREDLLLDTTLPAGRWEAFLASLKSSANEWQHAAGPGAFVQQKPVAEWPGLRDIPEAGASGASALCGEPK